MHGKNLWAQRNLDKDLGKLIDAPPPPQIFTRWKLKTRHKNQMRSTLNFHKSRRYFLLFTRF